MSESKNTNTQQVLISDEDIEACLEHLKQQFDVVKKFTNIMSSVMNPNEMVIVRAWQKECFDAIARFDGDLWLQDQLKTLTSKQLSELQEALKARFGQDKVKGAAKGIDPDLS